MFRYFLLYFVGFLNSYLPCVKAEDAIAITVYDFPPDIINTHTEPEGPLILKMHTIMRQAGLTIRWVTSSLSEESIMLNDGTRPFCTTGRYFSQKRVEDNGWVFLPYILHSLSGDSLVIHNKNYMKFNKFKNIREIFEDPSLSGVFIADVSYGAEMDDYLTRYPERFNRSAISAEQVIAMVANGRADYTIVTYQYWQEAKKKNALYKALKNLSPDIELFSNDRTHLRLACSRAVPQETLAHIERAMKHLKFKTPQEGVQATP